MRIAPATWQDEAAFYDAARPFWYPVARSVDVSTGSTKATTLLGEDLVIWRTADGQAAVADNLCAHRGTMLSGGTVTASGNLQCPYHGWEYDTAGICRRIPQRPEGTPIPTKARVASYPVKEQAGLIWTCLAGEDGAVRDVPECPYFEDEDWYFHVGTPSEWECQASRMVENFLDVSHFGIVHPDTFGNPEVEIVEPYDVSTAADMLSIDAKVPYLAQDPWGEPEPGHTMATVQVDYQYKCELPFTAWIQGLTAGEGYMLYISASPVTANRTTVFWAFGTPSSLAVSDDEIERREQAVFEPDRVIVEGQRPEWLPLDLTAELQMRFDALGVAFRKALEHHGFPRIAFLRKPTN
ncbi:aromatic ring-hydroxylating oxygenase subunit alpha [Streptomyces arenae]|uniref:aromatic ring-hydroxylating oxygenase subunit alpha n=1 Tax=Streptomyces arenae TaxID=29301 RepID=UPI002657FEDE|nr:aromatic ring-hydroxylating dioxygenase subunit alpha [Streptomyces arenae]MCG7207387.1 aromatic ring-hydroxylating dioxygenase subunit alpha [Streptomyces arenae]